MDFNHQQSKQSKGNHARDESEKCLQNYTREDPQGAESQSFSVSGTFYSQEHNKLPQYSINAQSAVARSSLSPSSIMNTSTTSFLPDNFSQLSKNAQQLLLEQVLGSSNRSVDVGNHLSSVGEASRNVTGVSGDSGIVGDLRLAVSGDKPISTVGGAGATNVVSLPNHSSSLNMPESPGPPNGNESNASISSSNNTLVIHGSDSPGSPWSNKWSSVLQQHSRSSTLSSPEQQGSSNNSNQSGQVSRGCVPDVNAPPPPPYTGYQTVKSPLSSASNQSTDITDIPASVLDQSEVLKHLLNSSNLPGVASSVDKKIEPRSLETADGSEIKSTESFSSTFFNNPNLSSVLKTSLSDNNGDRDEGYVPKVRPNIDNLQYSASNSKMTSKSSSSASVYSNQLDNVPTPTSGYSSASASTQFCMNVASGLNANEETYSKYAELADDRPPPPAYPFWRYEKTSDTQTVDRSHLSTTDNSNCVPLTRENLREISLGRNTPGRDVTSVGRETPRGRGVVAARDTRRDLSVGPELGRMASNVPITTLSDIASKTSAMPSHVSEGGVSPDKSFLTRSQPDLSRVCGGVREAQSSFKSELLSQRLAAGDLPSAVDFLFSENAALKLELEIYKRKVNKLQKFENEILKVHEAHENLVKICNRRESLELVARARLVTQVQALAKANIELKTELENVLVSGRGLDRDTGSSEESLRRELNRRDVLIAQLIEQNKKVLASKERLEMELAAQKQTLSGQRTHIEVLDSALNSARSSITKLEEDARQKQLGLKRSVGSGVEKHNTRSHCDSDLEQRLYREMLLLRYQQCTGLDGSALSSESLERELKQWEQLQSVQGLRQYQQLQLQKGSSALLNATSGSQPLTSWQSSHSRLSPANLLSSSSFSHSAFPATPRRDDELDLSKPVVRQHSPAINFDRLQPNVNQQEGSTTNFDIPQHRLVQSTSPSQTQMGQEFYVARQGTLSPSPILRDTREANCVGHWKFGEHGGDHLTKLSDNTRFMQEGSANRFRSSTSQSITSSSSKRSESTSSEEVLDKEQIVEDEEKETVQPAFVLQYSGILNGTNSHSDDERNFYCAEDAPNLMDHNRSKSQQPARGCQTCSDQEYLKHFNNNNLSGLVEPENSSTDDAVYHSAYLSRQCDLMREASALQNGSTKRLNFPLNQNRTSQDNSVCFNQYFKQQSRPRSCIDLNPISDFKRNPGYCTVDDDYHDYVNFPSVTMKLPSGSNLSECYQNALVPEYVNPPNYNLHAQVWYTNPSRALSLLHEGSAPPFSQRNNIDTVLRPRNISYSRGENFQDSNISKGNLSRGPRMGYSSLPCNNFAFSHTNQRSVRVSAEVADILHGGLNRNVQKGDPPPYHSHHDIIDSGLKTTTSDSFGNKKFDDVIQLKTQEADKTSAKGSQQPSCYPEKNKFREFTNNGLKSVGNSKSTYRKSAANLVRRASSGASLLKRKSVKLRSSFHTEGDLEETPSLLARLRKEWQDRRGGSKSVNNILMSSDSKNRVHPSTTSLPTMTLSDGIRKETSLYGGQLSDKQYTITENQVCNSHAFAEQRIFVKPVGNTTNFGATSSDIINRTEEPVLDSQTVASGRDKNGITSFLRESLEAKRSSLCLYEVDISDSDSTYDTLIIKDVSDLDDSRQSGETCTCVNAFSKHKHSIVHEKSSKNDERVVDINR